MEIREFDLTWIPHLVDHCLTGAGPIRSREVELDVHGPWTTSSPFLLARADAGDVWYGLLPELDALLDEEGWSFADVTGFSVNGDPMDAGVSLRLTAIMPWASFVEHVTTAASDHEVPTPSMDEVRALPKRPTTWEVGQQPVAWTGPSEDDVELTYAGVVHDTSFLRNAHLKAGAPLDAADWDDLFRRAAGLPSAPATPSRPTTIRVADTAVAQVLRETLADLDVAIESAETPLVNHTLDELGDYMGGSASPRYFSQFDSAAVRHYFDAADAFLDAAPWERVEPDRYVGVQIDDRPWIFATVMGHLGETPGVSLFDDWMQTCRFLHTDSSRLDDLIDDWIDDLLFSEGLSGLFEDPADLSEWDDGDVSLPGGLDAGALLDGGGFSPLDAAGALEAASGDSRAMLHPVDAAFLDDLGVVPRPDDGYLVPHRYDAVAGPVAPHFDVDTYRLVMLALLRALERRTATPVTSIRETFAIGDHRVTLRYPSDGTERPYDGPPGLRLHLTVPEDAPNAEIAGASWVFDAPATTLVRTLARVARSEDGIGLQRVLNGSVCLWSNELLAHAPSPRLGDLYNAGDLAVEVHGARCPLSLSALDDEPESIRVERKARP